MTRFAGPRCREYEPGCWTCEAWRVMDSWFENEQPAQILTAEARGRRDMAQRILNSGHNDDCILCGFKDKEAMTVLGDNHE